MEENGYGGARVSYIFTDKLTCYCSKLLTSIMLNDVGGDDVNYCSSNDNKLRVCGCSAMAPHAGGLLMLAQTPQIVALCMIVLVQYTRTIHTYNTA